MPQDIQRLFVAGSGLMGHGIAQVSATNHVAVTVYDLNEEILGAATVNMAKSLAKFHEKGRINEEPEVILKRIQTTTTLDAAAETDLVIEAIPEREDLKRDLFAKLDEICPSNTLFASNTSAIPISNIAAATQRPDQFCGLHFFSPVPLMRLVEVIRGVATADATVDTCTAFAQKVGKEPVSVNSDVSGFLMNRIALPAYVEAIRLLESGVADAESIDRGMRLGYGWAMGPLETCDMTGLDVMLHAAEAIYEDTGDPRWMPPMLLKRLVAAGHLGRKAGRGFYDHSQ